ncbi:MAG TPA: hypothetical protein VFB54_09705 [Burkholderiales bacterium]|nr:hypothetical protein [Burkholderiales bacterium]
MHKAYPLRLPPGAAEILRLRREGYRPDGWVIVDRAQRARATGWHVALPRGRRVGSYDLRALRGLCIIANLSGADDDSIAAQEAIEASEPLFAAFIVDGECTRLYWGRAAP